MALDIDTHDIDMLADIFRRRSLYLFPGAVLKGQKRAERHARRRRKRVKGQRRYKVYRIRYPTPNLIAHYINHFLYLRLIVFFNRSAGRM
jgi:hypothetical protein